MCNLVVCKKEKTKTVTMTIIFVEFKEPIYLLVKHSLILKYTGTGYPEPLGLEWEGFYKKVNYCVISSKLAKIHKISLHFLCCNGSYVHSFHY